MKSLSLLFCYVFFFLRSNSRHKMQQIINNKNKTYCFDVFINICVIHYKLRIAHFCQNCFCLWEERGGDHYVTVKDQVAAIKAVKQGHVLPTVCSVRYCLYGGGGGEEAVAILSPLCTPGQSHKYHLVHFGTCPPFGNCRCEKFRIRRSFFQLNDEFGEERFYICF